MTPRDRLAQFMSALPDASAWHASECDDGSFAAERIRKDSRLGIVFDPNEAESSWFWVRIEGKEIEALSGLLSDQPIAEILARYP